MAASAGMALSLMPALKYARKAAWQHGSNNSVAAHMCSGYVMANRYNKAANVAAKQRMAKRHDEKSGVGA